MPLATEKSLLLLIFVVIIILISLSYFAKDGFEDMASFIDDRQRHFASIGLKLKASKTDGVLGSSANSILSTVGVPSNFPLATGPTDLSAVIKKCEAVKKIDCAAFDDPAFTQDCGVCLEIGQNSDKVPTQGGLVVLPSDKKAARQGVPEGVIPSYSPTIGSCPADRLVTTKAECQKLQRQLQCEKNSTYDLPGCSQCYSTTEYTIVDPSTSPGVIAGSGVIRVFGIGNLSFIGDGFASKAPIPLSETTPYNINVRGKESTRIKLTVTIPSNSDPGNPTIPYISGVIAGPTQSGQFELDLRRIILNDEVTGRKPRSDGNKTTLKGATMTKMAPGFGQDKMILSVIVPFSFADPSMQEATKCKDAPFITTQASAEFLQSDPCYKKGSGPGKFSLECLQGAWITNGCTERGKGYPGDASTASVLMANQDGSLRTLNEISDYIYKMALVTSTGADETGKKQSIENWSKASVFCTGRAITSPCDTPTKETGPLSPDCINYLWNNEGGKSIGGIKNPIGPTYTGSAYSLFQKGMGLRFCQETGSLAPSKSKENVAYWQKYGGVSAVKNQMNNLHQAANAQLAADDKLAPHFRKCYGDIEFAKPPTCASSLLPVSFIPKQDTVLASNIQMTQDYILSMDITPGGSVGFWGSIIHFTTGPDCCALGHRAPGLWFAPGTIDTFALHIGNSNEGGWAARPSGMPFAVGKRSRLIITCKGQNITVQVDDKTYNYTHTGYRYSGKINTVYGSDPWYPAANCSVENVCLQTLGNTTATLPAWIETAKAGGWRVMDGGLSNITISDGGIIYGVNSAGNIYRRDSISTPWRQLPGGLSQIAAADNNTVIGVNSGKGIWKGNGNGAWTNIPGGGNWAGIGTDGWTWVIGTNDLGAGGNGFWFHDGGTSGNWHSFNGAASMLSIGGGDTWCVNKVGNIYKLAGGGANAYAQVVQKKSGSNWQLMPLPDGKPVRNIAVSVNGKRILAVTKNSESGNEGAIYAWNQGSWVQISGHLNQVAICDTMIVGVATHSQIWYLPLPAN